MRPARAWAALAAALLLLAACAVPPPAGGEAVRLTPVGFDALPGWAADAHAAALTAFARSCARLAMLPPDQSLGGSGEIARRGGQAGQWSAACAASRAAPPGDEAAARRVFEANFQPYGVSAAGEARYTGYYEPEVAGARTPTAPYRTPLLRRPTDLVTAELGDFADDLKGHHIAGRVAAGHLVPYYDRAQIDSGLLDSQRLGLVWLESPIDAFFLQIQGAGRVRLPTGRIVRVAYDAQNGRPYVPIGKVLVERGALAADAVSMQSIRAWLAAHPGEARAVMETNPSYVFFREVTGIPETEGPPGAFGTPLTPGRSAAVDRAFIPLGAPLYIATTDPLGGAPWQRLVVAQDRGAAITGPLRADIFLGWGAEAEARAGRMNQRGTEFLLLPRAAD